VDVEKTATSPVNGASDDASVSSQKPLVRALHGRHMQVSNPSNDRAEAHSLT
jgi:hypothetical protein